MSGSKLNDSVVIASKITDCPIAKSCNLDKLSNLRLIISFCRRPDKWLKILMTLVRLLYPIPASCFISRVAVF